MMLKHSARKYLVIRNILPDTGGKGIRTPGLLIANETLYQLSYTPVISKPEISMFGGIFHQAKNRFCNFPLKPSTLAGSISTITRATRKNDCSGRFRV